MMVKRQLASRNVDFEVKDIREDADALAHIKALNYTGTPVLEYGDKHVGGSTLPRELNAFLAEIQS
jgi:glutaredoxin